MAVHLFQKWSLLIVETASVTKEVNIWIIIGAVLGAIALLVIVILVLYKVIFYRFTHMSNLAQVLKKNKATRNVNI